ANSQELASLDGGGAVVMARHATLSVDGGDFYGTISDGADVIVAGPVFNMRGTLHNGTMTVNADGDLTLANNYDLEATKIILDGGAVSSSGLHPFQVTEIDIAGAGNINTGDG